MANAPLDAYIGFGQVSFDNDGKLWACLTTNNKQAGDREKYNFTGTEFTIQGSAFAGMIDGENYWLISTLASGSCNPKGGIFEFKVWKQGEGGAKGSFDKAAGEAQALQWQKDGCNAAIEVSGIPALKTFVKVLHELKIIATNETREIVARLNITDEQCPALEEALAVFWAYLIGNEGNTPDEGTPAYEAALLINDAGLMSLPALSPEMLPNVPRKNVMGKITGHKVECFPFTGNLPSYDAITVALPKKEEKKSGKGSWGSSGGVDPTKVLEARQAFIIKNFNEAGLTTNATTLKDVFDVASLKDGKLFLDFLAVVMGK
ncbi:hypothetical protein GTQ43_20875 [Nostoc sp. KVJ3]|uniref:hypothetical protein n=1 Tax=Nostoc sp. KVJ3 TaxID=457945 RepID=UPI0022371500|nr:hypothetical protein [Nostoc sp. KVJ3]MCW5315621.1 hypothetical protein [Nostoc sp. KVJ3]MCW5316179.1 hypothetical protein [Nostoc sp. KVJ3]